MSQSCHCKSIVFRPSFSSETRRYLRWTFPAWLDLRRDNSVRFDFIEEKSIEPVDYVPIKSFQKDDVPVKFTGLASISQAILFVIIQLCCNSTVVFGSCVREKAFIYIPSSSIVLVDL